MRKLPLIAFLLITGASIANAEQNGSAAGEEKINQDGMETFFYNKGYKQQPQQILFRVHLHERLR
jgi:hypothetical protein